MDLTVANIIMQQLGGNKFRVMTGVKNPMGLTKDGRCTGVGFKLPKIYNGVNYVEIHLNNNDYYDVTFFKVLLSMKAKDSKKQISSYEDIDSANLQSLFTQVTGLDTHL